MVIKSMSWKSKKSSKFTEIYNYLHKRADEKCQTLKYNLKHSQDIIEQFKQNYKLTPRRKNGVIFYHEVLSFNAKDEALKQENLIFLAENWLDLRAPKNLAYGIIHTHQNNLHIHLIISSNEIGRAKKHRLTKKQFKNAQIQLEEIQKQKYPHLTNSICQKPSERAKKNKNKYSQKEYNRYKRTKTISKKDKLKSIIYEATQQSDFKKYLKAHNIKIYKRGKNNGVIFNNKRYRFNTLGFDPKIDEVINKKKTKEQKAEPKPKTQREKNIKNLQNLKKRDELEKEQERDYN
jgi:hypothetical protein